MNISLQNFVESAKDDITIIPLIVANIVPLAGVLFFGWNIFFVLFYYWLESAAIGFFNILKIAIANGPFPASQKTASGTKIMVAKFVGNTITKSFVIVFFTIHFSIFMLGHLIFIFVLGTEFGGTNINFNDIISVALPASMLFISHGTSFMINYLGKKEYLNTEPQTQMFAPYGRVVVIHITIIAGTFLMMITGLPAALIGIFIILKTWVDISVHTTQHAKLSSSKPA